MRKSTCLWLLLAALCGVALFRTSQQALDARQTISELARELRKEENAIRVLEAEWVYLNQPQRLEKLAAQHLKLSPLRGEQFANLAEIPFAKNTSEESKAPKLEAEVALKTEFVLKAEPVPKASSPAPVKAEPQPAPAKQASVKAKSTRDFSAVLKDLRID